MVEFWLSLGAFMASHMIISRTGLRPRLIEWLGERFYYLTPLGQFGHDDGVGHYGGH